MKDVEVKKLDHFQDERGWLLKVLTRDDMPENAFGEIYITVAHPGVTKAKHYHKHATEWFCVIRGKAKLILQDRSSLERKEIIMGPEKFLTVKIPRGIAHAVKNIGKDVMYLVAVSDQPYNSRQPDTYPFHMNP